MSGSDRGFKRLAAEFVVIVVGVLVALGVDASWDARQERELEGFYLDQLRADLDVTRTQLGAALEGYEAAGDAAEAFTLALVEPELPAPDSLQALLRRASNFPNFRIITGTIDGLIEGGDLRVVRSPEVRNGLLEYRHLVQDAEAQTRLQSPILIGAFQRIGESANIPEVFGLRTDSVRTVDWRALADEPGVASAAVWLTAAIDNMESAYGAVHEFSLELSERIDRAR